MKSAGRDGLSNGSEVAPTSLEESPSAEGLRLAVAVTGIGVWDVDARTGRRRWSPEFKQILGLAADAVPDRDTFLTLIHPDDAGWVNEIYREAYEPNGTGSYDAEFRIIRANDKAVRWVATTGRVTFDENGQAIRGIGTLHDVHEHRRLIEALRESEGRLRVALAAGRMGTWRFDLRTGLQDWDDRQYALLGVDPSTTPTRELFLAMVHPDDRAKLEIDAATLPGPETFLDSEFRVVKPDGQVRWITAHSLALYDVGGNPAEMIGVNFDITRQKEAEARQEFLVSELNHRVKNTLATVQAIVGQTLRGADSLEIATEKVRARVTALSNTHDLLTAADWRGARLIDIVSGELGPYGEQSAHIHGPDLTLDSKAVVAFGIVFHELATNAAKYGALSVPEGRVEVSWTAGRGPTADLVIDWRETGGPAARPPQQQGLGMRLLEASVKGELGGDMAIEYAKTGLICHLAIPLTSVQGLPD